MIHSGIRVGGALVLWKTCEFTRRAPLVAGLEALGLAKFAPEPRPASAAFRDALEKQFSTRSYQVDRLRNSDAYEVMKVERQEYPLPNVRSVVTVTRIDEDHRIRFQPEPQEAEAVVESFNLHLGLLRAQQVTQCMVDILHSLSAASPARGVYWLPESKLELWGQVAKVIESAGMKNSYSVYTIRNIMDTDAIRAIQDAVVNEISTEAATIQKELDDPDPDKQLGERALLTRKAQLLALREKAAEFEGILGVSLAALTAQVESVEMAAAQAAMMAAVEA